MKAFETNNKKTHNTFNIEFCSSIHPLEPAGAILSNGVDMTKYIRFITNTGMTDTGEQLLDPELLKLSLRCKIV
ncbi:hypothetical protein DPMN_123615 [Dreissena polymorpha]|uniref:Uncharacterized protein n=1 Tax=Dreissena polymorpha TaxID=45954 RepID=A0A9D4GRY1_DREPO|nr:hypothetical protein DPMN_123615 [Dreissena polymorpha]